MSNEEWFKEYLTKGGRLFSIEKISTIRDGGTICLIDYSKKQKPFYIHKDNWTLHNGYPTTDDNIVTDKATQVYVMGRLERYKENCEFELNNVNRVIKNIKL